jgi:hypothetical protein
MITAASASAQTNDFPGTSPLARKARRTNAAELRDRFRVNHIPAAPIDTRGSFLDETAR